MKAYSLLAIFVFIYCVCKYTSVEIIHELKTNILNFGYRINFKYEGMFAQLFDKFYVITKFIFPSVNDLKFPPIDFDSEYTYLNADLSRHQNTKQYLSNLKLFCEKIVPFVDFYKKQINYYNLTAHKILMKEISLLLPVFWKTEKKREV